MFLITPGSDMSANEMFRRGEGAARTHVLQPRPRISAARGAARTSKLEHQIVWPMPPSPLIVTNLLWPGTK